MAYYNKIGMLILNDSQTKFLVCEPGAGYEEKEVTQFLMPGGQLETYDKSEEECLKREAREEMNCEVKPGSLSFVGEYYDVAATPGRDVTIRLYKGELSGEPKPSLEIGALYWIGKEDINNQKVSPIIKNKIIPDLVSRQILK